ncbi:hypothetical protein ACLKA6_015411 [Drosophila palustris]
MKCQVSLVVLLVSFCVCLSLAERPSHMLKTRRSSYINEPALLARSADAAADQSADQDKLSAVPVAGSASGSGANGNKDASSGRLFLKKFLMFKNMFGSNNQPVIPIIITSPGTAPTTSPSVVTVTSTGSIPSATGTVTTSPGTGTATTPTTPTTTGRQYNNDAEDDEMAADDAEEEHMQPEGAVAMAANAELLDEQAMQAALAAGAQEYEVFTDGDQADESKASQNNRINLRRKGGRRGQSQMISVRIPPRYRRYFKNGQKVMLNTKSRPNKRRVIRKRLQNKNKRFNNRRRGGKNKNKKGKGKNKRPRIPVV